MDLFLFPHPSTRNDPKSDAAPAKESGKPQDGSAVNVFSSFGKALTSSQQTFQTTINTTSHAGASGADTVPRPKIGIKRERSDSPARNAHQPARADHDDAQDSARGGDDELRVTLKCHVCASLPTDAHQSTCCGTLWCKDCFLREVRLYAKCPNCRRSATSASIVPDPRAELKAAATSIPCPNKLHGCPFVDKRDLVANHAAVCSYRPAQSLITEQAQRIAALSCQNQQLEQQLAEERKKTQELLEAVFSSSNWTMTDHVLWRLTKRCPAVPLVATFDKLNKGIELLYYVQGHDAQVTMISSSKGEVSLFVLSNDAFFAGGFATISFLSPTALEFERLVVVQFCTTKAAGDNDRRLLHELLPQKTSKWKFIGHSSPISLQEFESRFVKNDKFCFGVTEGR